MHRTFAFALCAILIPLGWGNQGSFTNSGGSGQGSAGVGVTSNAAAPSGALNLNCPTTGVNTCAGGNLTYLSNDGDLQIVINSALGLGCAMSQG